MTCLIDGRSTHNYINEQPFTNNRLEHERTTLLDISLANGSSIEVNIMHCILVHIYKGFYQIVLYHMADSLSSLMIISIQQLTSINPNIQWANYELGLRVKK